MKKFLFIAILSILAVSLSAKKKSNNNAVQVYMYGLSTSFNDTIAYMTDLQRVDSAYLEKGKFLGGMKEYVSQMGNYFNKDGRRTNIVFFKTDVKKAEKAYVKLRKRYSTSKNVELRFVPNEDMKFKAVRPFEE